MNTFLQGANNLTEILEKNAFTKIELSSEQWAKLAQAVKERDEFLKAKAIIVEHTYYGNRSGTTYKCLSEEELAKKLVDIVAQAELREKELIDANTEGWQNLKGLKYDYTRLLKRGFWSRVFNKIPPEPQTAAKEILTLEKYK